MTASRIYLDNAATSFPKPATVYDAVDSYQRECGVAVGRGTYGVAGELQRAVDRCRKQAASLFGADRPERIAFTFNGTDSLNIVLHGVLEPGDHVVTSTIEHNSVLRPLRELQERIGIEVSYVEPDAQGLVNPAHFREAITVKTKLVVLVHVSNVTGTIQPVAEVGEIAKQAGALFLVDAAQSAGHLPIDVGNLPLDFLACPGHKGLLGPLGTGLLYVRSGAEDQLRSLRQGGTGTRSEDDRQPTSLPDKYESGNHNAPGLVGLNASLKWLSERGVQSIRDHELELTSRFLNGLAGLDCIRLFGMRGITNRVGVVCLNIDSLEPHDLSMILDENFQIQTRAGLHCAPGVHRALGTFETGGAVRFSFGPFSTNDETDATITALREIAGSV